MAAVRLVGLILVLVVVAAPPSLAATTKPSTVNAPASGVRPCTSFGTSWASKYNAKGGPIKIVSVCCGLRSSRTHDAACSVMVTGRNGMMGAGMFGCSVATVGADGSILANKPLACERTGGLVGLPA
jgi:hypothetical protein